MVTVDVNVISSSVSLKCLLSPMLATILQVSNQMTTGRGQPYMVAANSKSDEASKPIASPTKPGADVPHFTSVWKE